MIALVWLLIHKIDLNVLWKGLSQTKIGFIILAVLSAITVLLVNSLRWYYCILDDSKKISFGQLVISNWTSFAVEMLFFVSYFGDLIRIKDLNKPLSGIGQSAATVFTSRISGFLVSLTVFSVAGLMSYQRLNHFSILSFWIIVLIFLFLAYASLFFGRKIFPYFANIKLTHSFWPESVKKGFNDFFNHLFDITKNKYYLSRIFFFSFLAQALVFFTHFMLTRAINVPMTILDVVLLSSLVNISTLFYFTAGGIGIKESIYVLFFLEIGLTKEMGLFMALLHRSIQILLALIGVSLFSLRKKYLKSV